MVIVRAGEAEEEVLVHWVRDWLDLMAAGRAEEACAQLDGANPEGQRWTPEMISAVVDETFCPGTPFRRMYPMGPVFTPVATARGHVRAHVGAFGDGSGYWLDHDVPLNGEVSDLTAQFDFKRRGDAFYVTLRDLQSCRALAGLLRYPC